jgi:hypothetical protein
MFVADGSQGECPYMLFLMNLKADEWMRRWREEKLSSRDGVR